MSLTTNDDPPAWLANHGWPTHRHPGIGALGAALLAIVLSPPQGPLGPDRARRAGVPTNLLATSERGTG